MSGYIEYKCELCKNTYASPRNLNKHKKKGKCYINNLNIHTVEYKCDKCDKIFLREYNFHRHVNSVQINVKKRPFAREKCMYKNEM